MSYCILNYFYIYLLIGIGRFERIVLFFRLIEFGKIRVSLDEQNNPYFCLSDVCRALELANPSDVKSRLDQDALATTEGVDSLGRKNLLTFIDEPNLYRCVFQSKKPNAKVFQDWAINNFKQNYEISKKTPTIFNILNVRICWG